MATQLFKDGKSVWVEADRVQNHLAVGWSPVDPNAPAVRHPPVILPPEFLNMAQPDAEREILKRMNILPLPIEPVAPAAETVTTRQKRQYRKKSA